MPNEDPSDADPREEDSIPALQDPAADDDGDFHVEGGGGPIDDGGHVQTGNPPPRG